jgi:hypothetical protein
VVLSRPWGRSLSHQPLAIFSPVRELSSKNSVKTLTIGRVRLTMRGS